MMGLPSARLPPNFEPSKPLSLRSFVVQLDHHLSPLTSIFHFHFSLLPTRYSLLSSISITMSVSAVRALRQLATCSSRTLGARTFTRAALPALRVTCVPAANANSVAKRAFSVSARRFGEGACESLFPSLLFP